MHRCAHLTSTLNLMCKKNWGKVWTISYIFPRLLQEIADSSKRKQNYYMTLFTNQEIVCIMWICLWTKQYYCDDNCIWHSVKICVLFTSSTMYKWVFLGRREKKGESDHVRCSIYKGFDQKCFQFWSVLIGATIDMHACKLIILRNKKVNQ